MGLFGGGKTISLPATPTFYQSPQLIDAINYGLKTGKNFTELEDLPPALREAISRDPEMSRLAIESTVSQLQPWLRKTRQDTINSLEANNQLTGSTTASALANIDSDFLSQITAAGLQASMEDINRAMANRVTLSGMGLDTIANAGRLAAEDQSQRNSFNLANYENEVARTLAGQKPGKGGLIGALTGGLGGALAGMALAPATGGLSMLIPALAGGLGAAAGGFGPAGTGGQVLTTGASVAGSRGLKRPSQYTVATSLEDATNYLAQTPDWMSIGLRGSLN